MILDLSLSFDRTSLSLSPLVVTNNPDEDLWIEVFQEPGFDFRYKYAPDSDLIPGSTLLAAVLEMTSLPVSIYARAASTAALRAVKDELAAAVSQFSYDLTLTVDGDDMTFSADPSWPQWVTDYGMASAYMARTSLAIRVNPPGA